MKYTGVMHRELVEPTGKWNEQKETPQGIEDEIHGGNAQGTRGTHGEMAERINTEHIRILKMKYKGECAGSSWNLRGNEGTNGQGTHQGTEDEIHRGMHRELVEPTGK